MGPSLSVVPHELEHEIQELEINAMSSLSKYVKLLVW